MTEEHVENQPKIAIDNETNEWLANQDTCLPINGKDIPGFKEWVCWNGFQLDRETGKGHSGFDFAAYLTQDGDVILGLPPETPVRAVADGVVAQVLDNPEAVGGGYGVMMSIEHGAHDSGMFSTYVHVVPIIEFGAKVRKGDIIGSLYKDPGMDEGRLVHLHLETISGWGTKGSSILGGGKNLRYDDPAILDESIYNLKTDPQGSSDFSIPLLDNPKIKLANFNKIRV